jgi:hypothetical protein
VLISTNSSITVLRDYAVISQGASAVLIHVCRDSGHFTCTQAFDVPLERLSAMLLHIERSYCFNPDKVHHQAYTTWSLRFAHQMYHKCMNTAICTVQYTA